MDTTDPLGMRVPLSPHDASTPPWPEPCDEPPLDVLHWKRGEDDRPWSTARARDTVDRLREAGTLGLLERPRTHDRLHEP